MLTGLTNISDIKAFEYRDGVKSPCDGELSYRGYNIKDLVTGGMEEAARAFSSCT